MAGHGNHVRNGVSQALAHAMKRGINDPDQLAKIAVETVREELCNAEAPPLHVFLVGVAPILKFGDQVRRRQKDPKDAGAPVVKAFRAMAAGYLSDWEPDDPAGAAPVGDLPDLSDDAS